MKDRFAILARDTSGKIISRVAVSANRGNKALQEVIPIARNMLRIKGCSYTEIHHFESNTSTYTDSPLQVLYARDLFWGDPHPNLWRP
jgi:hypothetical protein